MGVFVAGATGAIGHPLVRRLAPAPPDLARGVPGRVQSTLSRNDLNAFQAALYGLLRSSSGFKWILPLLAATCLRRTGVHRLQAWQDRGTGSTARD